MVRRLIVERQEGNELNHRDQRNLINGGNMKRKEPNTEPPRRLTDTELEDLRKDMQESSKWAREELKRRKANKETDSD